MNFIDLFSGIGGFRSGLEMNGHKCLAFAEIDKHARQSYKAIYDTTDEKEWHDVTAITNDDFRQFRGRCDIIVGGFPCQAFSVAGKRRGFNDTRGTLFFEIARAIKEIEPPYILLENVKGLFSHDGGRTFGTIIQALDELGYIVEWGLFNSKYWGVPQNRERVFILVTRKDIFKKPKLFDLLKMQTEVNAKLLDVLEDEVEEKYYLPEEKTKLLNKDMLKNTEKISLNMIGNISENKETFGGNPEVGRVYDSNGLSPTLAARDYKDPKKVAIKQVGNIVENKETFGGNPQRGRVYDSKGISPSLNCMQGGGLEPKIAVPVSNNIKTDLRIRKLTPLECWRLQGFTDEQFYKAKNSGVSNSQLYKQAGNSVTVNVIDAIVGEAFK